MPEYIKALIVVTAIALAVYSLAAPQLTEAIIAKGDYWRRAALWLAVTATAFLAGNFWVFVAIAALLLIIGGLTDRNPMAFYAALLCAVPPLGSAISGLGVVNYFFELNYLRLLSLAVLLPAALRLFALRHQRVAGPKLPDALLATYLVLLFVVTALALPFTTALRQGFYLFIDAWLVYYVASRSVRDAIAFREVAAAFVLGATIMAVIAIFEASRGWLLYATLESSLGVVWGYGNYMGRGLGGPLRAMASTGHPIVMGYLMVVTIPLLMYLRPAIRSTFIWWLALSVLLGALVVTLSRGPWVGGLAMALIAVGIGKGAAKRVGLLSAGIAAAAGLALLSDWGRGLLEYLPFIGTVGAETVEYRQRLFEVSIRVLAQSPFFGSPGFYSNSAAQELRQGEGIIDMVNSYLGIALGSGAVGFTLFVGLFLSVILLAWRAGTYAATAPQVADIGRTLLAAVIGILVIIGTTSSINVIPSIYYLVVGWIAGCCGAFLAQGAPAETPPDAGPLDPMTVPLPVRSLRVGSR